jgi:sucrose-6-phosphate hydrolase SacC (GH32 family)
MLGDFDGSNFTPRYGKYRNTYGAHYAAQTYTNTPDGKRVQIGWGRVEAEGMPFNQMMCFPTELTLRNTPEGIRMFSEPIAAISQLHTKEHDLSGMDKDQINTRLSGIKHDLLHVVARLESLDGSQIGIGFRGNTYCTMDSDELNRIQSPHRDPEKMVFDVEILIDRTSLEVFYQQGLLVFVEPLKEPVADSGLVLLGNSAQIKVHSFKVYELKTIWN